MNTRRIASIAAALALAASSGAALAQNGFPAASGELPFGADLSAGSGLSRAEVRAQLEQGHRPASGAQSIAAAPAAASGLSRAEVRAQAVQQIAAGHGPSIGAEPLYR